MSISIFEALNTMDGADPARSVTAPAGVDAAWRRLVDARDDVLITEPETAQRRSSRVLLIAASIVAVLVTAVAIALARGGPTGSEQPGHRPTTYPTTRSAAAKEVASLLHQMAPPGARPLTATLFHDAFGCALRCVTSSAQWSAPGSVKAAVTRYVTRAPHGVGVNGGLGNRGGAPGGTLLQLSSAADGSGVFLDIAPYGTGVVVRATVLATWFAGRTTAEYIGDVDSIVAIVSGPPGYHAQRTLKGAQAQAIVDLINAAPATNPSYPASCANGPKMVQYTLTIHAGESTVEVHGSSSSCVLSVSVNRQAEPAVYVALGPAILRDTGLPTR
jgi:hypothetical protein